jgi:2-polyprenyl-3-methyl-5-hydroxy-6-metoxy-1,4-benzoquinol methylase
MSSHWSHTCSNPNDIGLRMGRAARIRGVSRGETVDRIARIRELARDKAVLDVGCVSHEASAESSTEWLHRHVREVARECLGVDILEADIADLQGRGYNVVVHDLCRSPMPGRFDLVVCGEIIEHLPDVGPFLDNTRDSLLDGGKLVLSTPYPWFLGTVLRNTLRGRGLPGSMDHVAWYDPSTVMELADRHGFAVEEIAGINPLPSETSHGLQEVFYRLARRGAVPFINRFAGCRSLLYVLSKT